MKSRGKLLAATLLLTMGKSAVALPLTVPIIPAGESIRFSFAGWNEATTSYAGNCGTAPGSADAPGCDGKDGKGGIPARHGQIINAPDSGGAAGEDGWGVLRVTSIEGDGVPIYSNPVGNGTHITAFFYHLVDGVVIVGPTTTQTYSYGGKADFYITDDNAADPITGIPSPLGRDNTGDTPTYGGPAGITAGTLLLSLSFAPGGNSSVPLSTLSGAFNNASIGGGSTSLLDADITGGLWKNSFDTNTIEGADGNLHDLELDVGFRCGGGSLDIRCNPSNTNPVLFSTEIDGSFTGHTAALPEPRMLALIGIGLSALALLRRRRSASSVLRGISKNIRQSN